MEVLSLLNAVPYLGDVLQVLVALHAFALIVVNVTSTPTDDKWVGIVYKYIELLAGIVKPSMVKQLPGEGPLPV